MCDYHTLQNKRFIMEEYLGTILQFAFNYITRGWALCHGQVMSIAANQALFAIIGTTYGGDGVTTFHLPDLRKKKEDGDYYLPGEIMSDGTPYIESYICIEGIFPSRD